MHGQSCLRFKTGVETLRTTPPLPPFFLLILVLVVGHRMLVYFTDSILQVTYLATT